MGWGEVREHDAVRDQLARDLAAERARADAAEADNRRLRRELAGADVTDRTRTERVLGEVMAERQRQVTKWGGRDADGVENPATSDYVRLRVLAEEFGEAAEAMGRPEDGNGTRDLRTELVQVAAVAVAWVEGLSA